MDRDVRDATKARVLTASPVRWSVPPAAQVPGAGRKRVAVALVQGC
ncbi:MAG: hypothetical protein JXA33_11050 [Anaerolineae bacterium]|nr:hypothetical protein [Anaerolineae bacterium]